MRALSRASSSARIPSPTAGRPSGCDRRVSRRSFAVSSAWLISTCSLAAALALSPAAEPQAQAEGPCCCAAATAPRPQDRLWLISTREAGCPNPAAIVPQPNLPVLRYAQDRWVASDLTAFFADDDGQTRTVFYVHGNQTTASEAQDYGLTLYRALIGSSAEPRPIRFVIWSWPSDRVQGSILEDVRVKAPRSDTTGYFLATVLERLQPNSPLTLIGFSYGARAITGALQLTAGGTVAGRVLVDKSAHAPASLVLMAAAEDDDWLLPGRRNGLALSQADRLLNVYNGCDKALKRYHFLYGRRCCNEALGYVGLATGALAANQRSKVEQLDACCLVGSEHNSLNYFHSPAIMGRAQPYVFPK